MTQKENQNLENIETEENPVSALPKEEISEEAVSPTEETDEVPIVENLEVEKPVEQVENQTEIKTPEVVETIIETPIIEDTGLPCSEELAETTEKIEPIKPLPTSNEVDGGQAIQQTETQKIPVKPEIQTIEKIVYKTDPNFVQKLLIKARAKIQERKRKKLDKIILLFEWSVN